jgi:hypothetical protein
VREGWLGIRLTICRSLLRLPAAGQALLGVSGRRDWRDSVVTKAKVIYGSLKRWR